MEPTMARNTPHKTEIENAHQYFQVKNSITGNYLKIEKKSGHITQTQAKKFSGIEVKPTTAKSVPFVKKRVALSIEKAVIEYRNKQHTAH
jgi:hypothetical protein